jgi:hypothetical protein
VQSTADLAGVWRQREQYLVDHDRAVHAGRRLARIEDLANVGLVPLRVQLFVLLVKPARVLAGIARTPLVRRGVVDGHRLPIL